VDYRCRDCLYIVCYVRMCVYMLVLLALNADRQRRMIVSAIDCSDIYVCSFFLNNIVNGDTCSSHFLTRSLTHSLPFHQRLFQSRPLLYVQSTYSTPQATTTKNHQASKCFSPPFPGQHHSPTSLVASSSSPSPSSRPSPTWSSSSGVRSLRMVRVDFAFHVP
jgi:hypothetical protein